VSVASFVLATAALTSPRSAHAWPTEPGDLVNPLVPPEACEFCHNFQNADEHEEDPRYAPMYSWRGSLMANAARDPVFWAGIAVAAQDAPGQTELCVRCHSPRAFLDGDGDATSIDQLTLEQQNGVECELCHRMIDDPAQTPGNAQYTVDDTVRGSEVARRGPWDYTDGVDLPPHEFIYEPFLGEARFCGTCHDVTTPVERVDDAGVGMGTSFNEQRTYREWLNSDLAVPGPNAQTCQDCHLPAVTDVPGCNVHVNQQSHPVGGRRHDLVGANRFMVELLKQEYGSAGANLVSDIYYDYTLERIDEFLPSAASLDVQAPTSIDLTVGLADIDVTVTNETGHKLPSGYSEGRVMWIEVLGEYAGTTVFSSGAWDQSVGIQEDAQLRRYEGLAEQWSTGTELHLLLNDHWIVDNRIPPLGLRPDPETDPVGDRYALLPTGVWPNYDATSYAFAATPEIWDATPEDSSDDELTLTVRVRYLINSPEYIDFLGDNGGMAGADVASLFDLAGGATPVTLAESVLTLPIEAFGSDPPAGDSTESGESGTESATQSESDVGGTSEDESSDAGASDEGPAGCACGVDRPASTPNAGVILLFGLGAVRRRRRRR
jgi:MYXO-CTERM domain-containing protein